MRWWIRLRTKALWASGGRLGPLAAGALGPRPQCGVLALVITGGVGSAMDPGVRRGDGEGLWLLVGSGA